MGSDLSFLLPFFVGEFLFFFCSDLAGLQPAAPPAIAGRESLYKGYQPPSVSHYGRDRGGGSALSSAGGFNGFPRFQPPAAPFSLGRGGNGFGGGGGRRMFDSGRGGSRTGGSVGFGGGRGGGTGFDSRGGGRGAGRGGSSRGDLDNIVLPSQNFGNLVPFEKDFYTECASVRAMTESEVKIYRERRDIRVEGYDVPRPIRSFLEANFPGIYISHELSGIFLCTFYCSRNLLIVLYISFVSLLP